MIIILLTKDRNVFFSGKASLLYTLQVQNVLISYYITIMSDVLFLPLKKSSLIPLQVGRY